MRVNRSLSRLVKRFVKNLMLRGLRFLFPSKAKKCTRDKELKMPFTKSRRPFAVKVRPAESGKHCYIWTPETGEMSGPRAFASFRYLYSKQWIIGQLSSAFFPNKLCGISKGLFMQCIRGSHIKIWVSSSKHFSCGSFREWIKNHFVSVWIEAQTLLDSEIR